jgi:hypothetical protein
MATTLQESSRQRKLIYLGIIVALFTIGTFGWRGVDSALTGKPARWTVTGRANELELRELDQGNPELAGATVRLILTGSRGLAVCGLWLATIEKQRRHEWSQVELLVRSVTKLQPYFLTPWLFQSWNLAYNVSVESDRTKDKFFYIARGIELLAEGDRINRNNPDMRFWIGFYYLNKFGVADEANTLRSLFQLSCIDPLERDPRRFRPGGPGSAINLDQFEQFCKEHPQLVRRLREFLRCNRPDDVIDFLADNYKVPSRYEEGENSLTATGQTKRLPPRTAVPDLAALLQRRGTDRRLGIARRLRQLSSGSGLDGLRAKTTAPAHSPARPHPARQRIRPHQVPHPARADAGDLPPISRPLANVCR